MRNVMPECLEPRLLCAGDVAVRFAKGGLTLSGDGAANAILVERDGAGPGVRVSGQDGTTLNGQAGPLTFAQVTRDFKAKLGTGDDRLTVSGVGVGRNLSLDTGKGADAVTLDGGRVGRDLSVKGKAGAKAVDVRFADVAGRCKVSTGNEADRVDLGGSTFAGRVSLSTGKGDDAIATACAFNGGSRINDGPGQDAVLEGVARAFDFRQGDQGWSAGFADYPDGFVTFDGQGQPLQRAEQAYALESGLRPLPAELNDPGTGFLLSGISAINGINGSGDLFMFLKRRLGPEDGIRPGQSYQVSFEITFASNAPTGPGGEGGDNAPPGESVLLRAGAGPVEPAVVLDPAGAVPPYVNGIFRLNVSHGADAGNIANGPPSEIVYDPNGPYSSVRRTTAQPVTATADAQGNLWLLVGTDSAYHGRTALYYRQIRVTLAPAGG